MDAEEFARGLDDEIDALKQQSRWAESRRTANSGKRFSGTSKDRSVKVTIDGNGRLVQLGIAAGAHRGAHPERLGPTIAETVNKARNAVLVNNIEEIIKEIPS